MKNLAISLFLTAALAIPALAADFAKPITNLDGTVMRDQDKNIINLGTVAENALLANYPDEANLPGEEKMRRFTLARKIHDQRKDPALSAEEVALVKKLIAKAYSPLITGEAWQMLDPAAK